MTNKATYTKKLTDPAPMLGKDVDGMLMAIKELVSHHYG